MDEPDGFSEFLGTASPSLLRSAILLAGSVQGGEDLLQEALARAYQHWHSIDTNAAGYVRKTMIRLQSAWWKRKWRGEIPTAHLPETQATVDEGTEQRLVLRAALAQLPVHQRQVVVLRYVDDLSVAEVATLTGRSPGTVKSQSARGLERLRTLLDSASEMEGAERG